MRHELHLLEIIIQKLQKISVDLRKSQVLDDKMVEKVISSVENVNIEINGCKDLSDYPLADYADDPVSFTEQLDRWLQMLSDEVKYRRSFSNKIDYDFYRFSARITAMSEEELLNDSVACIKEIRENSEKNYEIFKHVYNLYSYFWGALDLDAGNIELLENRVHEIKTHWDDFCWLYENLADYRSKKVLYGILHFWLTFDVEYKNTIIENNYDDYYDYDLITCDENEVFVDLGAYNGDSALSFIDNYGEYKQIYCYEMTDSSMKKLQQRLSGYDRIICRQVAVGADNGTINMTDINDPSSYTIVLQETADLEQPHTSSQIPVVKLDDDIKEPITFLKMDIEGSELAAMKGAEQHIRKDKPKLAICSYHNNHHIYEIPRLMKEYNPDYKLYMRYHGIPNNPLTSEFITFAIP